MAISLESILTGKDNKPPRIVFYAVSGFGKTTFASQAPSPIFIQTEEGIGQLKYARFPKAETFNDVMEQLEALASQDHEYMTVVIDTIDLLERLIHEAVVAEYNAEKGKNIKSIGDMGFGAGYVKAMEQWEEVLTALDFLRNKKDMMCILLAHSLIKTFSPPDSDSYDRYRFNMHDKSSERIKDWADVVLFGNYKVTTKGEKDERKRAVGAGIRAIHTEERPAHWGKNRYSLPYEIPFVEGKQWSNFADLVWPAEEELEEKHF